MKRLYQVLIRTACCAVLFAVPATGFSASELPPYTPVTQDMLETPEPENWLSYNHNYKAWNYSALDQINAGNVSKLELVWSFATGSGEAHEAAPIVNNGYMFITTPDNQVIALNAATGDVLWRYRYRIPPQMLVLHPTNRGVAVWDDNVYMATSTCKLVSLDAETGKVNWTVTDGPWKELYYATLAPLAVKGKILMGCSGGETGVRGSVTAYNAESGEREWRFWTVPKPGQPGGDTWPKGGYKHGGASIWMTGSYDPETNITYWGTGNPAPWIAELRPGDNLYTNSTVALDADTGRLLNYFQYTPHGAWDWDEVSTSKLINTKIDGEMTPTVVHVSRSGFIYQLSRKPDSLLDFISATPFANNNVITSIDPETGRPTYDPSKIPGLKKAASYCPSAWGGKDWWPTAYSPETHLLYIAANTTWCGYLPSAAPDRITPYKAGEPYIGFPLKAVLNSIRFPNGAPDHIGQLQAWDLSTGEMVWKHNYRTHIFGPTTVTGGGLVFVGGTPDRMFRAFDAKTGEMLWSFPAPSGVVGTPVSYKIDGVQYIAVLSGWGVDAQRVTLQLNKQLDWDINVPQGGTLLVFALKKNANPESEGSGSNMSAANDK